MFFLHSRYMTNFKKHFIKHKNLFFNSGDWLMFLFKLMFYFLIQFDAMWCPHNVVSTEEEQKYKRDVPCLFRLKLLRGN